MQFEKYQLKNKTNVVLVPVDDARSFTALVMVPVGSRYESESVAGISHFLEHLFFKGTKKRPNTMKLTREIDRLGAQYNAFTGKEYTGYYIKTDANYTQKAMDILSDMLFNSLFITEEVEREKGVVVEEIRMYRDNPLLNIDNIFEGVLYKGALGRDIAGSEESVRSLKRSSIVEYKKRYYQPKNITIVIAGKIDKKVKKYLDEYFGTRKNSDKNITKSNKFIFGNANLNKRIFVEHKKTDQTQLMLGFPAFPSGHSLLPQVSVMNTILGGSMSSRLFLSIRERKGLAYMVKSGSQKYTDTGYVYVRVGLEAGNINKAVKAVMEEIDKLKKKTVGVSELKDAKTNIHGSLNLALEDTSALANWYARETLFNKTIDTPEQKMEKIEKVTAEQIKQLANRIFKTNRLRLAVIGDVSQQDIQL